MKLTELIFVIAVISLMIVACNSSTEPSTETLYPTAMASVQDGELYTYEDIEFDAGDSVDNDDIGSGIVEYAWDFNNDGIYDLSSEDPVVTHSYSIRGTYNVMLRVRDNESEVDTLDEPLIVEVMGRIVEFGDAGVESVIKNILDIEEGPVYYEDILHIYSLEFSGKNITSLSGLEQLPILESLYFRDCVLEDLSAFYEMPDLEILDMEDCTLFDPTPVSGLEELEVLMLVRCGLTDVAFVSDLIELIRLKINDNQVTDLSPVSNLTDLHYLLFSGNPVSDITPISGLYDLWHLFAANCSISDLTPLTNLESVNFLEFWNNNITDLQPLVDNPDFATNDEVHLEGNPLSNEAITVQIPALEARGVSVEYDH